MGSLQGKGLAPLVLLLTLAAGVPGSEEPNPVPRAAVSDLRVTFYANTMLAVGEWAVLPGEAGGTMFGPSLGGELEVILCLDRTLWGVVGRYGRYDTGGYVGTGEGSNRVEAAEARSITVLTITGYQLFSRGGIQTWGYLELGVEWLSVTETMGGIQYDYAKVFRPSFCAGLTLGADLHLTDNLYLPVKASYDVSFGQVLGYGDYSGQGADLVLAAGLGFVL